MSEFRFCQCFDVFLCVVFFVINRQISLLYNNTEIWW